MASIDSSTHVKCNCTALNGSSKQETEKTMLLGMTQKRRTVKPSSPLASHKGGGGEGGRRGGEAGVWGG